VIKVTRDTRKSSSSMLILARFLQTLVAVVITLGRFAADLFNYRSVSKA